MPQLPTEPDITPKQVYNPLSEDFSTTHRDENNQPIQYVVQGGGISTFPAWIADKITERLARHIVLTTGIKTNFEDEYQAALKEVKNGPTGA